MTQAYPLKWPEGWPRIKAPWRKPSSYFRNLTPFKAKQTLVWELERLDARHIVISSNAPLDRFGQVAPDALGRTLPDPGVAIYFMLEKQEIVMAQDLFDQPYGNVRSLALAIEAMRALERHGGGTMMKRAFNGFAALPPPGAQPGGPRPWREILEVECPANPDGATREAFLMMAEARFKTKARKAHPDAGGSTDAMAELNGALEAARAELGGGT